MKKLLLLLLLLLLNDQSFAKKIRLKDLVHVKGVRENPLIGYGLVIGLNGSGDGGGEIIDTSLRRMFQKLGLNPQREIASKNVASVIVTAKLPSFGRVGQKLDVTVSSIGNASSLAGGTLLVTPLKGGDGNIYGIATGPLSIGGLVQGSEFPTTGRIPNGGTIEKELNLNFDQKKALRLALKTPDFTNSARVEKTINEQLGGKYAISRDSATIDLIIPTFYQRKVVKLMAIIENMAVNIDDKARIIINERTGTIVSGGQVSLRPVAISHGDLSIEVKEDGGGKNKKGDKPSRVIYIKEQTTLGDLVNSLNALGTSPEDLISIFQTLKKNGSIIGDIEFI